MSPPGPGRELFTFLQSLTSEGRAIVAARPPTDREETIVPLLREMDAYARKELALECPALRVEAAWWAARMLYQLSLFVVCREITEESIQRACREPCPTPRGPETDWSVDLLFRHLPRMHQMAAHFSPADPLVRELNQLATDWPLSSVGLAAPLQPSPTEPPPAEKPNPSRHAFLIHPGLRRLYADRIVETGDHARLGDARIDELLRIDLGAHPELAPEIAKRLEGLREARDERAKSPRSSQ